MTKKMSREEFLERLLEFLRHVDGQFYANFQYVKDKYVENCKKLAASIPEEMLSHPEIIYSLQCRLFVQGKADMHGATVDVKDGKVVIESSTTCRDASQYLHPWREVMRTTVEIQGDELIEANEGMSLTDLGEIGASEDTEKGKVHYFTSNAEYFSKYGYEHGHYSGYVHYRREIYDKDGRQIAGNQYDIVDSMPLYYRESLNLEDVAMFAEMDRYRPIYSNGNSPTVPNNFFGRPYEIPYKSLDYRRTPGDPKQIRTCLAYHTFGRMFISGKVLHDFSQYDTQIQIDPYDLEAESREEAIESGDEYFVREKRQEMEKMGRSI